MPRASAAPKTMTFRLRPKVSQGHRSLQIRGFSSSTVAAVPSGSRTSRVTQTVSSSRKGKGPDGHAARIKRPFGQEGRDRKSTRLNSSHW